MHLNLLSSRAAATDWFKVNVWDEGLISEVQAALGKGTRVVVSGTLKMNEWTDKQSNQKRSAVVVFADQISKVAPMQAPPLPPLQSAGEQPYGYGDPQVGCLLLGRTDKGCT